nr:imm68 putative immunity domain-containing protein [uncultured Lachnoanaerobaculum sp.]
MYITKYWGDFIGGSDDSLNIVEFLEDFVKDLRKELLQCVV